MDPVDIFYLDETGILKDLFEPSVIPDQGAVNILDLDETGILINLFEPGTSDQVEPDPTCVQRPCSNTAGTIDAANILDLDETGILINLFEPLEIPGTSDQVEPEAACAKSPKKHLISDYKFIKMLGQGQSGRVMLAKHRSSGRKVAIKIIMKPVPGSFHYEMVSREIDIMKMLDHPNIVKLYEVLESEREIYLVMEYCARGDLYKYLDHHTLSEDKARAMFRQIIQAIRHCHENSVVHRDIKLKNIVLDKKKNIKITDFGVSDFYCRKKKMNNSCGTPVYMAPELLKRLPYTGPEVDMWSLGVLLHILVTRWLPFRGITHRDVLESVMAAEYKRRFPPNLSNECIDLIEKLLTVDPDKRLTMKEIFSHKWLKEEQNTPASPTTGPAWWTAIRNFFRRFRCRCCCRSDRSN